MLPTGRIGESAEAPRFGAPFTRRVERGGDPDIGTRTWTTERIEQLRHHVGAGMTCAEIARAIGVSRNAVIGKLNRLGISRGRAPAAPRRERTGDRRRVTIVTQRQILRAVYAEVPALAETCAPVPSLHRCSLLELAHGMCRWPLNEPGTDDFAFCGNSAVGGLSYCAGHARMAYRVPARRHG